MSKNAFVRRRSYRSAALMSVAAMATTGLLATAVPAGAALTQGEADATTGMPSYIVDDQGLALQLCLDACVEPAEEGEPAPPPADPNAAPYFEGIATAGGVEFIFEVATEVEAPEEPVEGEEPEAPEPAEGPVINALVVRADQGALTPNSTYRARTPWGNVRFQSDDRGGARAERLNHVQSFLRPLNLSGEMLGDGHVFTRVTGSPTGFNKVTVSGPGVNASTARFALLGQLRADTAMSSLSTDALKLGSITTAAASTKSIRVDSFGTADADVTVTKSGANPGAFTVAQTPLAGGDVRLDVTYSPRANRDASATLNIADGGLAAAKQVTLTGIAHDTLSPKVSQRTPGKGATVRPGKSVKVTFSEAVRGVRGSSFMLVDRSGDKVRASVDRVRRSNKYVLNPRARLDRDSRYTVKVNGGRRAIRDLAGNAARDMSWRFRTR